MGLNGLMGLNGSRGLKHLKGFKRPKGFDGLLGIQDFTWFFFDISFFSLGVYLSLNWFLILFLSAKTSMNLHAKRQVLSYSQIQVPVNEAIARDIGQSLSRIRFSSKRSSQDETRHVAFCQMPRQVVLLTVPGQLPRMQLGAESLLLGGFPIAATPETVRATSNDLMMDLGGNMMATPILLALLMSMMESAVWRIELARPPPQSGEEVTVLVTSFLKRADGVEDAEDARAVRTVQTDAGASRRTKRRLLGFRSC